jgi:signal peptidase I
VDDLDKPKPSPEPVIETAVADQPLNREVHIIQAPLSGIISHKEAEKQKEWHYLRLGLLISGFFIGIMFIFTYVVTPSLVSGISMQPTFYTGDVVLLWEFPETWAKISNSQYIPGRGNIVIVKKTPVSGEDLIKRVIGLPNETINVSNNRVTIYNQNSPQGFDPDKLYFKQIPDTAGLIDTKIGDGNVFVIGDNRVPGASIDSRSSIGPVSSGDIEGRVIFRIYPFNRINKF